MRIINMVSLKRWRKRFENSLKVRISKIQNQAKGISSSLKKIMNADMDITLNVKQNINLKLIKHLRDMAAEVIMNSQHHTTSLLKLRL